MNAHEVVDESLFRFTKDEQGNQTTFQILPSLTTSLLTMKFYEETYNKCKAVHTKENTKNKLNKDSVSAERFIPQHKMNQWDEIPTALAVVSPRNSSSSNAFVAWVNDPLAKRSQFDLSFINVLHYVTESLQHLRALSFSSSVASFEFTAQPYIPQIGQARSALIEQDKYFSVIESKFRLFAKIGGYSNNLETLDQAFNGINASFDEDRIILSTPESVAKLCEQMDNMYNHNRGNAPQLEKVNLIDRYKVICRDYIMRTRMLVDIEKKQAFHDMKAYDLYSLKFEKIEISPPQVVQGCTVCQEVDAPLRYCRMCAYHYAMTLHEKFEIRKNPNKHDESCLPSFRKFEKRHGDRKLSVISCTRQFVQIHRIFEKFQPSDKIVAHLAVPGVAENRPRVSIGDMLRFRFGSFECLGEVAEVRIATEIVLVFLPPYLVRNFYESHVKSPYFNALFYTRANTSNVETELGRFDLRFGLYQQRGYNIFNDALTRVLRDSHLNQLCRVIAPTEYLHRNLSNNKIRYEISDWATNVNEEQKRAVYDIVRRSHGSVPYIIYGPPGTGKTMTVVESIIQVLRSNNLSKILVAAPSDAACDVIASRLLPLLSSENLRHIGESRKRILRINWWCRNRMSLPINLYQCSPFDSMDCFKIPDASEIREASIIVCECLVAGCLDLGSEDEWMKRHFTHVFIDENSQGFEFETLIPLLKVGEECSIILAGDPKQLGPSVRSNIARTNGLSLSLQERLMGLPLYHRESSRLSVITRLFNNYRSHDALLQIPSKLFYGGTLRCKAERKITSLCQDFEMLSNGEKFPMLVHDVEDGKELSKVDTPSFFNVKECEAIVEIIRALLSSRNISVNAGHIFVITCFRAQVLKLRETLRKSNLPTINVGLVEDFQGQENAICLISTVLTERHERWEKGSKAGLGFMTDSKRFNVAITRASALCVIVGKVSFLENSGSFWSALIEHVRRNNGISSTENDDNDLYGIECLLRHVGELGLLGIGHEEDRYDLAMRGYYHDIPEWKVCL